MYNASHILPLLPSYEPVLVFKDRGLFMRNVRRSRRLSIILLGCALMGSVIVQIAAQNPPKSRQNKPSARKKNEKPKIEQPVKETEPRKGVQSEDQPIEVTDEIVKIDTELVQLDVTVVDQTNTPIYNLSKENFTVFEDKIQQMIESVSSEEVPINFGIVVDTSGSMRSKLETVKDAANGLLKQMRPEDEGFLAQFNYLTELVHGYTLDKSRLEKSLGELSVDGGTALLDAIIATSDYAAKKGKLRRKALIIISDGLERNSAIKEKEVMEAIAENEVQIYLVGVFEAEEAMSDLVKSENKRAKELLERLADASGGRSFFPKDIDDMPKIAAQIAKDLRTQYVINYYPSNERRDGTYRSVRVVVNSKDKGKLIARTRLGYFARPDKASNP